MQPNGESQATAAQSHEDSPRPESGKKTKPPGNPIKSRKKKRYKRWLRISIPFLCVIALFAGMAIGYVYLGKAPMSDIWKWNTWRHAFDLVFAP